MTIFCNESTKCQISLSDTREMYEIGAELHNSGLEALGRVPGFENFNARERFAEALKYAESVFPNVQVRTLFSEDDFVKLDRKIHNWIYSEKAEKLANYLQKKEYISGKQAEFLKSIHRIGLETEDFSHAANRLKGLKVSLIARTDLQDAEKGILFGALSIAIHSLQFWHNAKIDRNNPWNGSNISKMPPWLADLLGFVVGAVVGGAIAGPGGAVAGGVLVGEAASGKYNR